MCDMNGGCTVSRRLEKENAELKDALENVVYATEAEFVSHSVHCKYIKRMAMQAAIIPAMNHQ